MLEVWKGTIDSVDNEATHLCDLRVPGRVSCRRLLYAGYAAPLRGGLRRGSSRRVLRDGRDCRRQRVRVMARTDLLDPAVLPAAFLSRISHLGYPNLPGHLAGGSPVRLARPGDVPCGRSDHRPTAGLLVRREVSGVDGFRAGRCTYPRRRRGLCRYCGHRARRDAPDRRPLT